MVGHVWRHLQTRCFISQCGAFAGRHTAMASIEMVRPRGQGRGATSATTADAETLLPASEPPASARTRSAAPVAVARNGVGLFERIGDVADAMLPPPPRPRDPADRRRVWTWATVSFLLMCLMFASVAGGPGGRGTRTRQIELDASSSSIGNQQRDGERAGTSAARGSGLADDSKRAELESSAESDEIDDASDASAARTDDAFKPDTSRDDESIASEISGSIDSATAFVDVPIPRTKGTCVTRAARVPAVVDLDPTLIAPAAGGGGGGASGSAQWRELADALAAEATNATADLVLVGDSITEAWRGTAFGAPKTAYASAPEILAWRLGQHAPLPLAISLNGQQFAGWHQPDLHLYEPPSLELVSPACGPVGGGTRLTLVGKQLKGGSDYKCRFGGLPPEGASNMSKPFLPTASTFVTDANYTSTPQGDTIACMTPDNAFTASEGIPRWSISLAISLNGQQYDGLKGEIVAPGTDRHFGAHPGFGLYVEPTSTAGTHVHPESVQHVGEVITVFGSTLHGGCAYACMPLARVDFFCLLSLAGASSSSTTEISLGSSTTGLGGAALAIGMR